MKAIFLDIDGVIVTPDSMRKNYMLGLGAETQIYDNVALMYVGRLAELTGAKVVLSSTWREDLDSKDPYLSAVIGNLRRQLEAVGAPLYDVTPRLPGGDRSAEVGAWLDEHPCSEYVILDDLARFEERPEVSRGHLVIVEDSGGVRQQHFRKALDILNGNNG